MYSMLAPLKLLEMVLRKRPKASRPTASPPPRVARVGTIPVGGGLTLSDTDE
jgi:hypothetical protein